jgi:hypothetical protein
MVRRILSLAVATVVASVALPGAQETIVGRNEPVRSFGRLDLHYLVCGRGPPPPQKLRRTGTPARSRASLLTAGALAEAEGPTTQTKKC